MNELDQAEKALTIERLKMAKREKEFKLLQIKAEQESLKSQIVMVEEKIAEAKEAFNSGGK